MRKIAVVVYEGFCMFEFSVALETLALSKKYCIDVYGEEKKVYKSEEGLPVLAEYSLTEMNVNDYDGLILTGFSNEDIQIIKNELFLDIIRQFDRDKKLIAAISAAPVFLVKAGIMKDMTYMCACPKDGLRNEGFTETELEHMLDWEDSFALYDKQKAIRNGHIVTSVCFGFCEWAKEISQILNIPFYNETFGL